MPQEYLPSEWGYTHIQVENPGISASDWGYAHTQVENLGVSVSDWGYASTAVIDIGKPNLMISDTETDVNWHVMKNSVQTPIVRWTLIQGYTEVPLVTHPAATPEPSSHVVGSAGAGSANFSLPSTNTIFVSPSGADGAAGTVGAPLQTVAAAISRVTVPGTTIILRAGSYHEQLEVSGSRPAFTIQNYPNEEVWFDGTSTLSGWTANGNGTWSAAYNITYDRQLGKGSNISVWSGPATRVIVDQVWVDGVKLTPVADNTTPGSGQFSVNQGTHVLTIGTNPSGKTVRVADLNFAIAGGSSISVKGVGFRRYSPAMMEWRSAIVHVNGGAVVEEVTIQDSGINALSLNGSSIVVRNCTFQDTGHSNVMGDNTANLMFEKNIIRRGNRGDWDPEPTTAGIKITRVFAGVTVRHNYIADIADGAGIWFDTTVSRSSVVNNTIIGTSALGASGRMKNGIEIEGSDGGYYDSQQYYSYVVGNRISDCRHAGILIFDSGWIRIWNNKVAAAVALYLWQDYRQNNNANPVTEGTPQQSPWHTRDIEIVNNDIIPESVYLTQLRAQCNSDAAFKIAGGSMISLLARNWFKPAGTGNMAYISNAAGSSFSTRNTLALLEALAADYGGPLAAKMNGNVQSATEPSVNTAMPLPAHIAAAYDGATIGSTGYGALLPPLTLAG